VEEKAVFPISETVLGCLKRYSGVYDVAYHRLLLKYSNEHDGDSFAPIHPKIELFDHERKLYNQGGIVAKGPNPPLLAQEEFRYLSTETHEKVIKKYWKEIGDFDEQEFEKFCKRQMGLLFNEKGYSELKGVNKKAYLLEIYLGVCRVFRGIGHVNILPMIAVFVAEALTRGSHDPIVYLMDFEKAFLNFFAEKEVQSPIDEMEKATKEMEKTKREIEKATIEMIKTKIALEMKKIEINNATIALANLKDQTTVVIDELKKISKYEESKEETTEDEKDEKEKIKTREAYEAEGDESWIMKKLIMKKRREAEETHLRNLKGGEKKEETEEEKYENMKRREAEETLLQNLKRAGTQEEKEFKKTNTHGKEENETADD